MDLGEAIAHALKGHRQMDVAEKVGVSQNTISRWKVGENQPRLEEIAALEDACDRPRGFILRLAGFAEPAVSVVDAIASDPSINDVGRFIVLGAYQAAQDAAAESR